MHFFAFLGLSTFAFSYPLLTTLGDGVAFFIAHNLAGLSLTGFTLAVYLGPAIALWIIAGLLPRVASAVFVTLSVSALAAIWLSGLLRTQSLYLSVCVALFVGIAVGIAWAKRAAFRDFLATLGQVSLLLPLWFLMLGPASGLVIEQDVKDYSGIGHSSKPVVMLVLDELNAASLEGPSSSVASSTGATIDRQRLPNFARLADMSTWYRNTSTVSTLTDKAVPALLTGNRPRAGSAPLLAEHPQNLFTVLQNSHRIEALETVTRLCPARHCRPKEVIKGRSRLGALAADTAIILGHKTLPQSVAVKTLPSLDGKWSGFGTRNENPLFALSDMGRNHVDHFAKFANSITLHPGQLSYYHLALPHYPWLYLPSGQRYNGGEQLGRSESKYEWGGNETLVEQATLRYALQLEHTDLLLGLLLDALEQQSAFKDTLLIVVADHGIAFSPNAAVRNATAATISDVARVPLFIKYPQQSSAEVDDRPAQTLDVLATVADVLDIELRAPTEGVSLRQAAPTTVSAVQRELVGDSGRAATKLPDVLPPSASQAVWQELARSGSAIKALAQGPLRTLYGRAEPAVALRPGVSLTPEHPEWYRGVASDSAFLPVLFTGEIQGTMKPQSVAIALNGTIAGTARSWIDGERHRVAVMLDPTAFIDGDNTLNAYLQEQEALLQVGISSAITPYLITVGNDGSVASVQLEERKWTASTPNALQGAARLSSPSEPSYSIGGWALDSDSNLAPTAVLLLHNGQLMGSHFRRYTVPFTAHAEGFPGDIPAGFSLELGGASGEQEDYRVIALFSSGELLEISPKPPRKSPVKL